MRTRTFFTWEMMMPSKKVEAKKAETTNSIAHLETKMPAKKVEATEPLGHEEMSVAQLSQVLKCSKAEVERLAAEGRLPRHYTRDGGRTLVFDRMQVRLWRSERDHEFSDDELAEELWEEMRGLRLRRIWAQQVPSLGIPGLRTLYDARRVIEAAKELEERGKYVAALMAAKRRAV